MIKYVLLFAACLFIATHALSATSDDVLASEELPVIVMGDTQHAGHYAIPEGGLVDHLIQQNPQLLGPISKPNAC